MEHGFGPALPLGTRHRQLPPDKALAARIRAVLETRPGTLPFRKDFGCRLDDIVGQMATGESVSQARQAIQDALSRWLPDVDVSNVAVRVVPRGATSSELRYPEVPVAERALLSLGTQADLEVSIEIRTASAESVVRTTLSL